MLYWTQTTNLKLKIELYYMTQKIYVEKLIPDQRRFVIMQRSGSDYINASITYQQDPGVQIYVSRKLHNFVKFNFLSRAKFIGEFDSDSIFDTLSRLTKVYEYSFLKTYHQVPVNQLDFFLSKMDKTK